MIWITEELCEYGKFLLELQHRTRKQATTLEPLPSCKTCERLLERPKDSRCPDCGKTV